MDVLELRLEESVAGGAYRCLSCRGYRGSRSTISRRSHDQTETNVLGSQSAVAAQAADCLTRKEILRQLTKNSDQLDVRQHMKHLLTAFLVCLVLGCASKTEQQVHVWSPSPAKVRETFEQIQ